jgi:predicted nucleic acid-binding protein
MAGYFRYTAVLDACVLYPAPLRDLMLSLASTGIFHARWTSMIQQEWLTNLLANRPDLPRDALLRTATMMNMAVEDCLINKFEFLIDSLALPDPGDRHVLAAAIVGHADAIVTFNLRDFPPSALVPHGIEVLHPDDFLVAQYDLASIEFLKSVKANRLRLRNPPKTPEQMVATYEAQGLTQTALLLREAIGLI